MVIHRRAWNDSAWQMWLCMAQKRKDAFNDQVHPSQFDRTKAYDQPEHRLVSIDGTGYV
jgi:hypothetical protein